jgi:hypothetical protein
MREKLKKPSPTSPLFELLESKTAIFLDRDQGDKIMPDILKKAGIRVECHSKYFVHNTKDDVWIREVSGKGWLIITSDKKIENDPDSRLAVIESKAKIYFLEENNSRAVYWAASILVSKERIYELARDHSGPFYINLHRKSSALLWKFREPNSETFETEQSKQSQDEASSSEKPDRV